MSKTARTDEIDELVSSVRDFVSHKEPSRQRVIKAAERLILTAEQRVSEAESGETPVIVDAQPVEDSNILVLNTSKSADRAGLEATIAELEAAVTAQPDDWEADEGESFEASDWAVSAFHTPPADSDEALDQDAESAPETVAAPDTVADEPQTSVDQQIAADVAAGIDEDSLRALVVAIVHDELGGEMGERITRNVRKLVRREINRVLLSREMTQD